MGRGREVMGFWSACRTLRPRYQVTRPPIRHPERPGFLIAEDATVSCLGGTLGPGGDYKAALVVLLPVVVAIVFLTLVSLVTEVVLAVLGFGFEGSQDIAVLVRRGYEKPCPTVHLEEVALLDDMTQRLPRGRVRLAGDMHRLLWCQGRNEAVPLPGHRQEHRRAAGLKPARAMRGVMPGMTSPSPPAARPLQALF